MGLLGVASSTTPLIFSLFRPKSMGHFMGHFLFQSGLLSHKTGLSDKK